MTGLRQAVFASMFAVIVTLATGGAARAQVMFLDPGASGALAGASVATNDDFTRLSIFGSYGYQGLVDVGVMLHRYSIDTPPGVDASGIGLQPFGNVHFLRERDGMPVSVFGAANFQKIFYSVDPDTIDYSAWSLFLGGGVYKRFAISPTWSTTPQGTLGIDHVSFTADTPLGESNDSDSDLLLHAAGNFAYSSGRGTVWVINPFIMINGGTTFGVDVGALFAL